MTEFKSFKEFWPWYLQQHAHPMNVALHALATVGSVTYVSFVLMGAMQFHLWLWLAISYGPSWIGHYKFEKNKPATSNHPLWSLIADFRLCGRLLLPRKTSQ